MGEERSDLFRKEALEAYRRGSSGRGDFLRLAPTWTRWTFWCLIAAVAAGLIYTMVVKLDEYARGPAVVQITPPRERQGEPACTIVGFLPAEVGQRAGPGTAALFLPDGIPAAREKLTLTGVAGELTSAAEAARALAMDPAEHGLPPGPLIRVEGDFPGCTMDLGGRALAYYEGMSGTLEARVGSERLLVTLVPGLRRLLGAGSE